MEAKAKAVRLARWAGREAQTWAQVETLIGLRNRKTYDAAIGLIDDLRALIPADAFAGRIEQLRARHGSKRSFIAQLNGVSGDAARIL